MKILITGASGFVGTHLVEFLSKKNKKEEIFCLVYGGPRNLTDFVSEKNIFDLNLLEAQKVEAVVKKVRPDKVIHLAALAGVGSSFKEPQRVLKNNIIAAVNLLEPLRKFSAKSTILLVGSADEYGLVESDQVPISESAPLRPTSPYSVSKVAVDYMGLQYFLAYDLKVIRIRPFNHIGEYQSLGFAVADFAKQIVEAELERKDVISVGNLAAIRDFTDVKDMVRAYRLAIEKCQPGEVYNIGSGKGVRMQDLLNILISHSTREIRVEVDPKLYRPIDVEKVVADPSKFQSVSGWKPTIPLEDTLVRVLHYWRKKLIDKKE